MYSRELDNVLILFEIGSNLIYLRILTIASEQNLIRFCSIVNNG